jgi:RNA polymerase sigma factor (sigma-70 family)
VTETLQAGSAGSDAELITQVRAGDRRAYGELYTRHSAAALTLARQFSRSPAEADDLVSESFARVLDTLISGGGPDSAFRAYLFTTLRNTAYDRSRKDKRLQFTDDVEAHDSPIEADDPVLLQAENTMVGKAFAALPERWQAVLWYTQVDGMSPAEAGVLLGMSANAVTSLAYRAREGLRESYLQAHLTDTAAERCRTTVDRLGAWARGGLSKREQAQVDAHLEECDRCRALAAELAEINSGIRGLIAPLLLGGAAAGYLAATSATPPLALASAGTLFAAHAAGAGATAGTAGAGAGAGTAGAGAGAGTAGAVAAGGAAGGHASGVAAFFTRPWVLAGGGAVAAAVAAVVVAVSMTGNPAPSTAGSPPAITSPTGSAAGSIPTSAAASITGPAPGQTGGTSAGSLPAAGPSAASTSPSSTTPSAAPTTSTSSGTVSTVNTPPAAPPPIVVTPIPGTQVAGTTTAPATSPNTSSGTSSVAGSASSGPATTPASTAASTAPVSTSPTGGTPPPTPAQLSAPQFTASSVTAAAGGSATVSFTVQNSGQTGSSPQTVGVSAPSGVSLVGGSGVVASGSAAVGLRRASALFGPALDVPPAATATAGAAGSVSCSSASCSYTVPANSTLTVTLQLLIAPDAADGTIALSAGADRASLPLTVEAGLTSLQWSNPAGGWHAGTTASAVTLVGHVAAGVTDVGTITLPTRSGDLWITGYPSNCDPVSGAAKPSIVCSPVPGSAPGQFGQFAITPLPSASGQTSLTAALSGGRSLDTDPVDVAALVLDPQNPSSYSIDMTGPFGGALIGAEAMSCATPAITRGDCRGLSTVSVPQTLTIPEGATVVSAIVTWAATAPASDDPATLDTATFHAGEQSTDVSGAAPFPDDTGQMYVRTADVTSDLVGTGPYWVDNIQATKVTAGTTAMAGWSLAVIWYDPTAQARVDYRNPGAYNLSSAGGTTTQMADSGTPIQSLSAAIWAPDPWAVKTVTDNGVPLDLPTTIDGVRTGGDGPHATGFTLLDGIASGAAGPISLVNVDGPFQLPFVTPSTQDGLWIGPTLVVRQPG